MIVLIIRNIITNINSIKKYTIKQGLFMIVIFAIVNDIFIVNYNLKILALNIILISLYIK